MMPSEATAQRRVLDVAFEGNQAFSRSELKSVTHVDNSSLFMKALSLFGPRIGRPTFNYLVMGRDVTYLRAFYRNRGYLQCRVEERTEQAGEDGLIVHFTIDEGPLTTLLRLEFTGNELYTDDQLKNMIRRLRGVRLRDGDPINESAIRAGAEEVLRQYRSRGHYFTKVRPRVGRRDSTIGAAPVTYHIREGPIVRVSDVVVEGTRYAKEFVVRREVILEPGDLLTEDDRRESQRRLYSTGIFRTVGVTIGEVSPDSTTAVVLVTVSEIPKRYVGTGVGLAGDPDAQFDLLLRTSAQWGHRNVFGTGRAIELSANEDFQVITGWQPIQGELSLRYLEPWFGRTRTPMTALVTFNPKSYELFKVQEVATEIGFSREFTPRTRGWLNFTYRIVGVEIPKEDFSSKDNLRGVNATIERDSRDNILSPTRGSLARIKLSSYGLLKLGGPMYAVVNFLWTRYQITGSRTVLATRMRLGYARPGGNIDEVPIFDRFFAGGANSVRGYEERMLGPMSTSTDTVTGHTTILPRGGEAIALFNMELRRPRYIGPFGLLLFIDAGDVWETAGAVDFGRLACSTGIGIFLDTPIGPVRYDYGWQLNRGRGRNWHLSVLYAF